MTEIEFKNNPELENPSLEETVNKDNKLKEFLVDYVGKKHEPENGDVTVDLIVSTMVEEFPEFMEAVAVENWIRGYHQAIADVDDGQQFSKQQSEDPDVEDKG